MTVLCVCDLHGSNRGLGELVAGLAPELVLVGGDLTHGGGVAQAAEVLRPLQLAAVPFLAVPGNMDREPVLGYLEQRQLSVHGRGRVLELPAGAVAVAGVGGSPPTPFHTPFELAEEQIAALLEAAWPAVAECQRCIVVAHPPPHGTALDLVRGGHVGSTAVRAFATGPAAGAVFISGHIHEAHGVDTVDSTLCVNTGAFRDGRYAVLRWPAGAAPQVELRQLESRR